MMRRALVLLAAAGLLAWAMLGCIPGRSSEDREATIVARVVATLQSMPTVPATRTPPEPTITPVPQPTATPLSTLTPIPGPTVTPPAAIEAEEYAVYSALMRQNPVGFDLGRSIVVRQRTVSDLESLERTLQEADPLPERLVESYRSRNAARYALDPRLDVDLDYALMPESEFERIFLRSGPVWARFEERYPEASGLLIFSRVGLSADEDQALALMGYRCGDLCGAGGLYLLAKEGGEWKVQETLMTWIS